MRRKIIGKSETAAFLGILEGKQKKAKSEAEAAVIAAKTRSELDILAAKTEALKSGYKSDEQQKAEAEITTATLESQSSNTLYYVIAAIVVVVIIGLYFIKKR